ncbi:hypothetical protein H5P28_07085 [Ruficoccus amylovorans]|uniref:Ribbon-helix-helix protein CopG domain-containing protein n=1 Tax=Ruficoccus amylovorans TaxID=1804625 RepID=A0A842HC30_9BACT|nr:hypothetical protein [Ruficoccus amylovorans]MBC2594023.1 hypothetical protein [Ruficoccus amylovorans]
MSGQMGKDSALLGVVVSKEMKAKIQKVAKKEGRSASNWIRFHIEKLLEQHGAKG